MESQNLNAKLKAKYRKIFKQNLLNSKRKSYALDCRLQKALKARLTLLLRFHKRRLKRPFCLLFYYPLSLEFDNRKLLRFYRKQRGIRIFLPKIQGESFKAVPYRLPLTKMVFNVYESANSRFCAKIDCAVVPVLGVDKTLRRIGFGKGMYDRFFDTNKTKNYAQTRKKRNQKIIFICRNFNFTKEIITESHDIRGDFYITSFDICHLRDFKQLKKQDLSLEAR